MRVGSLFSGVGGFDLGFERAGMRIVFQAEADAWCRDILAQHWPHVPCAPDVRMVRRDDGPDRGGRDGHDSDWDGRWSSDPGLDVLCGGFPCQDLSVAGKRRGLSGERSGLFFEFARIADELVRPGGWIVVENVPGLLSSASGRDFAVLLRTLGDIGFHDLAWRVLDSRYFGVPQRRRRVFIVGRRAAGSGAREVLLEPESGGGNFAPSRQARPRVAASLSRGSAGPGISAPGRRQEDDENLVANTLKAQAGRGGSGIGPEHNFVAHTLRAEGFDASEDGTGRGTPLTVAALTRGSLRDYDDNTAQAGHLVSPDGSNEHRPGMVDGGTRPIESTGRRDTTEHGAGSRFLRASAHADGVRAASGLPRWVDDPRPDGPRYSAMGNAVTVPVLEWLGRRIVRWEGSVGA